MGNRFYRWLLINRANPARCTCVRITPTTEGSYAEFPRHPDLDHFDLSEERSRFGGPLEGLYLRREKNGWLDQRAKLVRAEFVQLIGEHWSNRRIEKNHLSSQTAPA